MNYDKPDDFVIEHFPPIPDLSLKQRADVGAVLTKEQGKIDRQMQKKRQLVEKENKSSANKSEKAREKFQKKTNKIDQKINQLRDNSNKKIKKILSEEQYRVFMEKRDEFRFRKEPSMQFNGRPDGQGRGDRSGGRR
jgi:phenylalanyl-tRNA synthetase alpha subunit